MRFFLRSKYVFGRQSQARNTIKEKSNYFAAETISVAVTRKNNNSDLIECALCVYLQSGTLGIVRV